MRKSIIYGMKSTAVEGSALKGLIKTARKFALLSRLSLTYLATHLFTISNAVRAKESTIKGTDFKFPPLEFVPEHKTARITAEISKKTGGWCCSLQWWCGRQQGLLPCYFKGPGKQNATLLGSKDIAFGNSLSSIPAIKDIFQTDKKSKKY